MKKVEGGEGSSLDDPDLLIFGRTGWRRRSSDDWSRVELGGRGRGSSLRILLEATRCWKVV